MMADAKKSFYNEVWKEVIVEGNYTNKFGLQVSDYGRVRSINQLTGEPVKILTGSRQEGYAIVRKKFLTPQPDSVKGQKVRTGRTCRQHHRNDGWWLMVDG